MKNPSIGELEKRDIQTVVSKVLKRLGNPEPPLVLDDVRSLLQLDRQYFSSTDDGAIRDIVSKVKCGLKQLIARPTLLKDVIAKAKLSALWLPDRNRILIDQDVPILKHRWMEIHEVVHSLIPWHQGFMLGDTEHELSPACHASIEAEANYGAGQLSFLMNRFVEEAQSVPLTIKSILALKGRFGNSINATLWRTIEEACPNKAVVGLISEHPRYSDTPCKYCVESPDRKSVV